MNWLKKKIDAWKDRYWNDKWEEGFQSGSFVMMGRMREGPLKRRLRLIWEDVVKHRWAVYGMVVAVTVALLRPWK